MATVIAFLDIGDIDSFGDAGMREQIMPGFVRLFPSRLNGGSIATLPDVEIAAPLSALALAIWLPILQHC